MVPGRSPGSSFLRLSAGEITPIIDALLTTIYRCYNIYILDKKIEKDNLEKQGRICAQFPTFSFRYITTNNHYNLDFFNDSDRRKKEETIHKLYERIEEISKQDWIYWGSLNKKSG